MREGDLVYQVQAEIEMDKIYRSPPVEPATHRLE